MTCITAFLTITLIVLPQWLLMVFKPKSVWTQKLVESDIIPFVLLLIYVVCLSKNRHHIAIHEQTDLLQFFSIPPLALGAWAYVGFITLVIGSWLFNNLTSPNVKNVKVFTSNLNSETSEKTLPIPSL